VSERERKENGGGGVGWRGEGLMGCWAAWPERRGGFPLFFFVFFLFQSLFKTIFKLKFKSKFF
jgi:hypothetical protein